MMMQNSQMMDHYSPHTDSLYTILQQTLYFDKYWGVSSPDKPRYQKIDHSKDSDVLSPVCNKHDYTHHKPQTTNVCTRTLITLIILKKYAWKPILSAVDARNKSIEDALKSADKAKKEMLALNTDNERILMEAKKERDALLKEGREIKDNIIDEAKDKAKVEADKILITAKEQINNEKMKAITELKNQVAEMSIDIAEKILKSELSDKNKQKELIAEALKSNELN